MVEIHKGLKIIVLAKKHCWVINTLLERTVKESTPKNTNGLESNNVLLKPFSRIAKFFHMATALDFIASVALIKNFDVKNHGIHQGSISIQRAEINQGDLCAIGFFSVVGLNKLQILSPYFQIMSEPSPQTHLIHKYLPIIRYLSQFIF